MANANETSASPRPGLDACWSRIGVQGDHSCPELQQHVHCRNCPVHAAAALSLLDAEPPAGYLAEWTGHFAQGKKTDEAQTRTVVIFRLAREWLALPTAMFREIAPLRPVHSLPHRRDGLVSGIVNVRGELLVCVALDRLLGVDPAEDKKAPAQARQPRLAVISRKGERVVFRADEVHGIHRFDPRVLQETPATLARASAAFTGAVLPWQDRTVGCLDEQKLWQTLSRSLA